MTPNEIHALAFKSPALVDGQLTYLHGQQFLGRLVVLCFLPYPGRLSADVIDRQAARLEANGATLLIVHSGFGQFHRLWMEQPEKPLTPILADPCGRLHRSFGVPLMQFSPACSTFVIDRTGVLRLRVRHGFIEGDLEALLTVVAANRRFTTGCPLSRTVTAMEHPECLPL